MNQTGSGRSRLAPHRRYGARAFHPETVPMLPAEIRTALEGVSTATLTTVLLKKGIRRSWM